MNPNLAIFGNAPAFPEQLHVGRPNIGDRESLLKRIGEMLDRCWLTNNGPLVKEFESALCSFLGVKHCIAMSNATVGLEIAIRAAGLQGEVIVPSFTFIATAHALQWQRICPVFCDVDPNTHNIDPIEVEKLITPRTTGIIGVHLWGKPCDIDALQSIADRHGLTLLFDAAHAIGSQYHGEPIGGFGLAEVFSFHATKVLNAFEGGVVATNDDELARKARLMNNFGFTGMDSVEYIGTNGKMNEASAAMGLTSLESFDDFVQTNRENHQVYARHLAHIPGLKLLEYPAKENNNHQYVIVEVDEDISEVSRDLLIEVLHAENVRARRYFYPGCHDMEPYRSMDREWNLPETTKLAQRVMCLPTGTAVDADSIEKICKIIELTIQNAEKIKSFKKAQQLA
jgi:dTDP-4-amino-4,6-dideoxygalactose transaminase